MSKCISTNGEYSEHEPSNQEFVCGLCFAFDEDAVVAEVDSLRQKLAEAQSAFEEADSFAKVNAMNAADYFAMRDEVESLREQLAARDALVESQARQIAALTGSVQDVSTGWDKTLDQLAEREAVIERAKARYLAESPAREAATDMHAILSASPSAVLAEHDARVLEEFAVTLRERYPDDVFVRPSDEDYDRLNEALARSNIGLDRFSADLMRRAAAQADREAAEYRKVAGQ